MPTAQRQELRRMICGVLADRSTSAFAATAPPPRTSCLPRTCLDEIPALAKRLADRWTQGRNWINRDDIESAAVAGGTDAYYSYEPGRRSWTGYRDARMKWAINNWLRNANKGDIRIRSSEAFTTISLDKNVGQSAARTLAGDLGSMTRGPGRSGAEWHCGDMVEDPKATQIDTSEWRETLLALVKDDVDRYLMVQRHYHGEGLKEIAAGLGGDWTTGKVFHRLREIAGTLKREIEGAPCAA